MAGLHSYRCERAASERAGHLCMLAPPAGRVWSVHEEARLIQVSQDGDTLNEALDGSVRKR